MQTDPNPANFYYCPKKNWINLIDYGSARHFDDKFVENYFEIVDGSFLDEKERIHKASLEIGFLTGEENKDMLNAHFNAALQIGSPFKHKGPYFDFGNTWLAKTIEDDMKIMVKNRLTPPPPEIYALHWKLSGAYWMNIKLKSKVDGRGLFEEVWHVFNNR